MPWKVSGVMEQRFRLIERWTDSGESVSELARRFGVCRKTVYKWLQRYELGGLEELKDHSRRPLVQAARTPAEVEAWITDLRRTHPSWGPRKLRAWLERKHPEHGWPAESTIGLILERQGLNGKRAQRRHATPSAQPLEHAKHANDVWSIDFKGCFRCGNGERCDPLTVSDAASRYLLCCRAVAGTDTEAVEQELTRVFRRFGLPQRMRSDNGSPFASTGVGGLSRLSVWWIRLGIVPERIEPGEPQQNGRHERMHRTLKAETAAPPAENVDAQQRRFTKFIEMYNHERPHQALDGDTPSDRYERSPREFSGALVEVTYPAGMELRRTDEGGKFRWKQVRCRAGKALAHQIVGVEPVDDGVSRVWFGPVLLGLLDERKGYTETAVKENSHWPPLARPPAIKDDGTDRQKV
jgi:transposase InsO family protein